MAIVKAYLCPQDLRRDTFSRSACGEDLFSFVKDNVSLYEKTHRFAIHLNGEEAAEEVFDLTNNPCRDAERDDLWGSLRCVCVGDVVECLNDNGVRQFFLCENVGWSEVDLTFA